MAQDPAKKTIHSIRALDIMVRDPIVATENDKVRDIEQKMIQRGIGGLPVVKTDENGKRIIVGMITHRDILLARHAVPIGSKDVKDLMSQDIVYVFQDSVLLDILQQMSEKNVERLPVVNGNQELVGIITHRDILSILLRILKADS